MNIVITGISGFVGKNVSAYLSNSKGYTVKGVDMRADWKQQVAEDTDVIIHLAGKAHDLKNTSQPGEYYRVNYELTKQLYDVFLKSNASTFIFMSTVKAAADRLDKPLQEKYPPAPGTDYGKSKLKAEQYIQNQPLPYGKVFFILRPCMIHGPGNKGNLNLLYKFVQKGIPYPLAAYRNERSFLSVDNLNYILGLLISESSIPGGIYNLADDIPLSTNQVITIIAGITGLKSKLWRISPRTISFLAKAGDILHLPLNSERLKKLTESYVVANEKIKGALNLTCLPLSSEDGLKLTIRSFQSS